MTPEEISNIVNELEAKAKDARKKLYAKIGRDTAYMLLGAIIGGAVVAFLGLAF